MDETAKPKKIVLFSDGTGNSAASPHKTNVWRAYRALDLTPDSGQVAYYDQGVGTSRFTPLALFGLACGFGLARNVRDIYGFLCRTYRDGDKIYVFGFSRGAFTIRVVASLIASQGIIDPAEAKDDRDLERLIGRAYATWRKESFVFSLLSAIGRPLDALRVRLLDLILRRRPYAPTKNRGYDKSKTPSMLIDFVGVWDTVDAYGLPLDELTRAWDMVVWPLMPADRDLSKRVQRACHALALDERRESFEPMLWNEDKDGTPDTRIRQVWFAGMHADVGGGYPDDALAYGPLNWMLDESAKDGGLTYIPAERAKLKARIDPLGPLHNSRDGLGNFYRYAPRDVESLCNAKNPGLWHWLKGIFKRASAVKNEVTVQKPKIHHSVFDRIAAGGDGYAPVNLPKDYTVIGAGGDAIAIPAPPAAPPPHLESAQQASDRRKRQAAVWVKVWWRKQLYVLALLAMVFFAVYPYSKLFESYGDDVNDAIALVFGDLGNLVAALPGLLRALPGAGFFEGWIARYQEQPFSFLLLIAIIGALLWSRGSRPLSLRR